MKAKSRGNFWLLFIELSGSKGVRLEAQFHKGIDGRSSNLLLAKKISFSLENLRTVDLLKFKLKNSESTEYTQSLLNAANGE